MVLGEFSVRSIFRLLPRNRLNGLGAIDRFLRACNRGETIRKIISKSRSTMQWASALKGRNEKQ
jgi:hypothetical protein